MRVNSTGNRYAYQHGAERSPRWTTEKNQRLPVTTFVVIARDINELSAAKRGETDETASLR
jgi:hypothetical protein